MSDNPLAKLDKARAYLAECRNLPEIKKIRDLALAAKEYGRAQKLSAEIRNHAWEIQIEAERRAIEFLDGLEKKNLAGRPKNNSRTSRASSDYKVELDAIGITTRDASRWRTRAMVPEKLVASYIAQATSTGKEVSTKGLLALAHSDNGSKPKTKKTTSRKVKPSSKESDMEACIRVFGPFDALRMRLRALVIEVMKRTPAEQWPELIAIVREQADSLAQRKPRQ